MKDSKSKSGNGKLPKHQLLHNKIKAQILSGQLKVGTKMPPETKLVKTFRASNTTVRHALRELMREGLIVRRRGSGTFICDPQRPPLVKGKHLRIGLLWSSDIPFHFHDSILPAQFTEGALKAFGLLDQPRDLKCFSDKKDLRLSWEKTERAVSVVALSRAYDWPEGAPRLEWVEKEAFDGVLCFSIVSEAWIAKLLDMKMPVVLVDYPNTRFARQADQVFFEPLSAYSQAVKSFVDQGYKRIHYLSSSTRIPPSHPDMNFDEYRTYSKDKWFEDPDNRVREMAYRMAMTECGIKVEENWIHQGRPDEEYARNLGEQLTRLPAPDRPEALICHTLAYGRNLRESFVERGLPLLVAGATHNLRDGSPLAIHGDGYEMGEIAAELLLSRFHRPDRRTLKVGVEMACGTGTAPRHFK